MSSAPHQVQEYAMQVAAKAARQAYNEASQIQIPGTVQKALAEACNRAVVQAERAMEPRYSTPFSENLHLCKQQGTDLPNEQIPNQLPYAR